LIQISSEGSGWPTSVDQRNGVLVIVELGKTASDNKANLLILYSLEADNYLTIHE